MLLILTTPAQAVFTDTPGHQWQNSIEYLQEQSIVNGYEDGSFGPDLKISRAEFIKILMEGFYEDIDARYYGKPCFSDLNGHEWWAKYACLAKDEKIINGYGDGSFGGERLITQPEALKIILNTLEEPVGNLGDNWYDRYFDYSDYLGMYYFDVKNRVEHEMTRAETSYFITWLMSDEWLDQIDDIQFQKDKYRYDVKYHTENAEECFEGEAYDSQQQICYLACESEQECIMRESEALADLAELMADYDASNNSFDGNETPLSIYSIKGDQINHVSDNDQISDPNLLTIQANKAAHEEVWNYFAKIIPSKYRRSLDQFQIFSDGYEETLAFVEQTPADLNKWILYIDLEDSHPNGVFDKEELTFTIVHEFAHLLTLEKNQINYVEIDPNLDDDNYSLAYDRAVANCEPNYYPGEGCSNDDSYLNAFYQEFWTDGVEVDPNDSTRFVTDYAATNPAEDIAESFMMFVLMDQPANDTIANQKLNFFYQYPELENLREFIRMRI